MMSMTSALRECSHAWSSRRRSLDERVAAYDELVTRGLSGTGGNVWLSPALEEAFGRPIDFRDGVVVGFAALLAWAGKKTLYGIADGM